MRIDTVQARELSVPAPASASPVEVVVPGSGSQSPVSGKNLPSRATVPVPDVHVAAELIDQFLRQAGRELSFSVDDVTGRTVVSVRDPATGDLIRQMPSEEALRIARNLEIEGAILVDELA